MDRPARMREHPPTSAATAYILAAAQENAVEGFNGCRRCCRNRIVIPDRARPTLGAGGYPVTGGCLNRPELGGEGGNMKKAEFERQYAWTAGRVRVMRETPGYDNDRIRAYLIGIVTSGGRCYTSDQLRRIFDLAKATTSSLKDKTPEAATPGAKGEL